MRQRRAGRWALLAALWLLVALVGTWPLALHWRDHIPGPPWDGFVWLYDLWWLRESLFVRGISPFWQSEIFVPFGGYAVLLSDVNLSNKALALPLLLAADQIVAYNGLVLLSSALSGLGAFLLARRLTGSAWGGVAAGLIFAWSPYRLTSLAGGLPPVFATQWLPFVLLALEWLRDPARAHQWRRNGALLGLFTALQALTSWYNAYTLALVLALWIAIRFRHLLTVRAVTRPPTLRVAIGNRPAIQGLALGTAIAATLVLPPFVALLRASRGAAANWTFFSIELWQAGLDDFLRPSIFHPLWGGVSLAARGNILPDYPWNAPGVLYLGWIPVALALLALWRGRGRWRWAALAVLLAAGLLALGPTLHWNGQRAYLPVGDGVKEAIVTVVKAVEARAPHRLTIPQAFFYAYPGKSFIPLPPLFGYLFVGFLQGVRWWLRFSLATTLMVALLAAAGIAVGGRRVAVGGWRTRLLPAALLLAITIEFWPAPLAFGLGYAGDGALERRLRELPPGTVIELPLVRSTAGPGMYRQVWHRKPLAGGVVTYFPPAWQAAAPTLAAFPSPESVALLRSWGVRWVVLSPALYDSGWADQPGDSWAAVQARLAVTPGLRIVATEQETPSRLGDHISPRLRERRAPIDPDRVLILEVTGAE